MPSDCISFKETGYFSSLICDYLDQKEKLAPFYKRFPSLDSFKDQILEKKQSFSNTNRQVLVESLTKQYQDIAVTEPSQNNINLLLNETTFTVTTGHQLNLFTGPLYFLYKIISTINLTEQLKETYGSYDFVPVYWMASEDHDFLEINYFTLHGKKIAWNKAEGLNNANGYVGDYDTNGLKAVFEVLKNELGGGKNAEYLKQLFEKGYLAHDNLTDATRYIVNELFGAYGLVIVDGNDTALKSLFKPVVTQELEKNSAFAEVTKTTEQLKNQGYKAQVTPREINLFYGVKGYRERIVQLEKASFSTVDFKFTWPSLSAILQELETKPEHFSPNALMRPVYQEVILPNLCYIGGGGELAYWFQLKESFKSFSVPFPIVLLRNSALLISKKQQQKLEKLSVSPQELFMKSAELINYKVRQVSDIPIDFSEQKKELKVQFKGLEEIASQTDKSFLGAVKAQQVKQLKGLDVLEKRLLKAQRLKLSDHVSRLTSIHNELFPHQSLQERKSNFSEFYLAYGADLIPSLKEKLDPLGQGFSLIYL
ncbi:bacillithiol biosynthesis cysteine-adding enzyme BshC [Aquimarina agarilytica]|uniref:bacillithiol biosynthesis cysteine-adding enzyme BshC n=1 Tax=Aquimarina agarilytica TaxID=1087449 RepID=UPI00028929E6|nr:bacillithiol biosynthesis cysteine-adding enzyme BshC [Aquimarina agarilytica]